MGDDQIWRKLNPIMNACSITHSLGLILVVLPSFHLWTNNCYLILRYTGLLESNIQPRFVMSDSML